MPKHLMLKRTCWDSVGERGLFTPPYNLAIIIFCSLQHWSDTVVRAVLLSLLLDIIVVLRMLLGFHRISLAQRV